MTCGFYNGTCTIYEVRPAACRMYGVVREMPCGYFPNAIRTSYPADRAIAEGVMTPGDQLLSQYFAPDRGVRQMEATAQSIRRVIPVMFND